MVDNSYFIGDTTSVNNFSLGSLNFGVSYTLFNTLTISSGTGVKSASHKTNFEFGTMLWLGKKINIEYRRKLMNLESEDSSSDEDSFILHHLIQTCFLLDIILNNYKSISFGKN